MPARRFVVIGAGVVGAAVADELTARGETDVTVVDKGPLYETGGSSSHAPGLISRTSPSKMMQELADYTLDKFGRLASDGAPCVYQVGTLEVARTQERLQELRRRLALTTAWGWRGRMVEPSECAELWPIIDPEGLVGGFATRDEGLAVAVRAVEAQARAAIDRGATFVGERSVTGIEHIDGRVTGVITDAGTLPADVVVCCAGVWSPAVADLVGLPLPMLALEHQYVVTSPVPQLSANADREATLPIVRHHDAGLYFRDHGDRVGIGSFNHRRLPVDAWDLDTHPRRREGVVYGFTPEDFEPAWDLACELMPALRSTTLERSFNGVFAFTPDGYPLIGEHPDLRGFWVAASVWVTHSAGVGRVVAETLVDGAPWIDASPADLSRFAEVELAPAVFRARCDDSYRDVYAVHHPAEGHTSARDLRGSPFATRQRELGAVWFDGPGGWERPRWYETNAAAVEGMRLPARDGWASRFWSPVVAAEHLAVRDRGGLFDMTPLTRIEVAGPDAEAFLRRMCAGAVARPAGSVTYTVMLDTAGGIRSDVTVARVSEDRYLLGANGPRDVAWLRSHAPAGVSVDDITGGTCCLAVWGPGAREALAALVDAELASAAFPYLTVQRVHVGEVPVTAVRISYAGELGWELIASAELGARLWDTVWPRASSLGLVAAGSGALAGLRIEKGYRAWGIDLTPEHTPDDAGLAFTVRSEDPSFLGAEALAARAGSASARRLRFLEIGEDQVAMGGEPVFAGTEPVGYVTSAAYGFSVGRSLAYAWLDPSIEVGTRLDVGYFERRLPATLARGPAFDPSGRRLRG